MKQTLFDKIWNAHEIACLPGDISLLHIDRHLMHELTGVDAMRILEGRGVPVRNPGLTFATLDHVTSTRPGNCAGDAGWSSDMINAMRKDTVAKGIALFDNDDGRRGIVHVVGPELGLSLPGTTIVCADSHTCTHGAFGALAWGIGSSELVHVLATQTIRQRRPRTMRIKLGGVAREGVTAKDIVLYVIGQLGASAGTGHAVEFAGQAVRDLDMEGRMTLCNLSIELGAKIGLVAPDETTFRYLRGREFSPREEVFDQAMAHWATLPSDSEATYEQEVELDISGISPQVTWGTSPEHVVGIDAYIPDPHQEKDSKRRQSLISALEYMQLKAGQRIDQIRIDRIFIGSCTNSRLSDLREAAQVLKDRHIAPGVTAWVVPGSLQVKKQAESEGLHKIFEAAGCQWREPGCSMCVGANGDLVGNGERCVSTSNRNFVGRQGPGAMTHLASPAVAAASAVVGTIASPAMARQMP
ncbi:3-isopropylmalate dehydratase large subunit [Pollutimonas harenae]|uniref:3-isopropylmalate dehydratase n=1 Tax=Pollutimonas harenae TaxID=657015 RepID=A0A853GPH7_9BURK|nr:3-isopropylmalate dehydratase large subunit [Pollutimonas harenae]NYT84067.1 3-isopropylmalate dehydratase large subunit [Pollutimonas harenae]TEA73508.1 3-isopropylmalate dehydratase large subunit [Pollutimonas harenae]